MRILQEAEEELTEATEYYENLEPGLGLRLLGSATHCFQWIAFNPTSPRLRGGCFRRVNLKVFPFYVAYQIHAETLWILAFAHARRRPGYWRRRKPPANEP